jgi:PAS domain S-box-containing protein
VESAIGEPLIQQSILLELIDRAPALIFVADPEMRYLAVNSTSCETLGYSREELLEMRVTDVAAEAEAPQMYQEMMRRRQQSGEATLRTKDDRLLHFSYVAHEVTLAGMRYYIAVGFIPDD